MRILHTHHSMDGRPYAATRLGCRATAGSSRGSAAWTFTARVAARDTLFVHRRQATLRRRCSGGAGTRVLVGAPTHLDVTNSRSRLDDASRLRVGGTAAEVSCAVVSRRNWAS